MSDDDLMPVTRGMLRRWVLTLDSPVWGPSGSPRYVVAEAMRALLEPIDSSPDPEGAEAAQLAPESDTAEEAR